MKITDKAASASLPVPKGLSPALIGKVVTVNGYRKNGDAIIPEVIIKFVGVLKSYTLTSNCVYFTMDGGRQETLSIQKDSAEFILYQGS